MTAPAQFAKQALRQAIEAVGDEQDSHDLHFFTKHAIGIHLAKLRLRKPLIFKVHIRYYFGDICTVTSLGYDSPHSNS